ncbi:MAG TPA: hypothetical protein VKC61_22620 [Pyrinomonadaceae bacterium]|nr:hypothetical protein [Pyrinomonadaceae bacterium]
MKIPEIKSWALDIVGRIKSREPTEDSRVECKASWLDVKNVSRQLAGHANAASGEPVLWLIGVDEKGGVVAGASHNELANWYPQLVKEFDGVAPCLVADLNIAVEDKTIVALLFETTNAPFVVKVPNSDRLEIPWREGTRTRSAKRAEVLRILSLLQNQGTLIPVKEFASESPRAQNLAIERPPFWEYLLTIELLKGKLQQVRRNYDDVNGERTFRKARIIQGKDFTRMVQEKMSDIVAVIEVLKSCVEIEIPASWGLPGEPGDAIEIKRAVDRFIAGCNELVEWESEMASLRPPEAFSKVQSLMRGLTSQNLAELERFAEELGKPFAQSRPTPGQVIEINLKFDFPEGRIDEITSEAQRIVGIIESDPEAWSDQWN